MGTVIGHNIVKESIISHVKLPSLTNFSGLFSQSSFPAFRCVAVPLFWVKGSWQNGPGAPLLVNNLHGPALKRISARGRTVGTAAGASQYEPPVAPRAPTLFYAGASCFSTFPALREVAGPLLWEKGSCQMGPQRRVWKITLMGPL